MWNEINNYPFQIWSHQKKLQVSTLGVETKNHKNIKEMPPRKLSTGKRELCASDPHYVEKRAKNNDAVKKSREKTRLKAKETMEKVTVLKQVKSNEMKIILNP